MGAGGIIGKLAKLLSRVEALHLRCFLVDDQVADVSSVYGYEVFHQTSAVAFNHALLAVDLIVHLR